MSQDIEARPAAAVAPPVGTAAPANWKPRFFAIWTGQAFSLVGSALTQFVLMWWITQTTGSARALATAAVAGILPAALFGPLGGAAADRWSRRVLMIVADAITAACMFILIVLFATSRVQLWHVYALMAIRSTMQAFQGPAASASTANLVPMDWLTRAAGMNQTLQGLMSVVAPALGALAMAVFSLQGALAIDLVTALLGITPLLFYRIPQPRSSGHEAPASVVADIVEGARYVMRQRGLFTLYALTGLVVLTIMPTFALTPLWVTQQFGGGIREVALMEAAGGVGVILGGLLITAWPIPGRRIVTVLVSYALSCGAVALAALAPAGWLWLAMFWWAVSGFTFSTGNAPFVAIIQTIVPNELQGRALSLFSVVFGLAAPVGLVLAGPIAEAIGVRNLFILGGTLSALVCAAGLLSGSLRNIEPE